MARDPYQDFLRNAGLSDMFPEREAMRRILENDKFQQFRTLTQEQAELAMTPAMLGLGDLTHDLWAERNALRAAADIAAREYASGHLSDELLRMDRQMGVITASDSISTFPEPSPLSAALMQDQIDSYSRVAELWIAGDRWHPSILSVLSGIDENQATIIGASIDRWRDMPGYTEAFSAMASASDAIAASHASIDSVASLVGDVRAMRYAADFQQSQSARLTAYLDAGFDPDLLKPNQQALSAMLTLNGYVDPAVWLRRDGLAIPFKRVPLKARLKALKPTKFQVIGYREIGALERWLREFIHEEMSVAYGEDWYKHRAPKSLMGKFKKRFGEDVDISGEIVLDEADMSHYIDIILQDDHWAEVFSFTFENWDDTRAKLTLLKSLRVSVAHFKGFGKADLTQVRVCARWIAEKIDDDPYEDEDY